MFQNFRQAMTWLHTWFGLVLGFVLMVVFFFGSLSVFDREIVFLGSFNLDPRSAYLDTEVVFVVHSPALATQVLDAFATDFQPANAWHIGQVAGEHKAAWITEEPGRLEVEPHDPAGLWRRMMRSLAKLLPVRKYL